MERDGRFTAGPLRAFVAWMVWVGGSMALPAFPFVAVMAGLALSALGLQRRSRRRLKAVAIFMIPLALGFGLVHGGVIGFLTGAPAAPSPERVRWAAGLWLRILSVVSSGQLWLEYVPPSVLITSLFASSLPAGVGFLLASPLLLGEQIRARLERVRAVARARTPTQRDADRALFASGLRDALDAEHFRAHGWNSALNARAILAFWEEMVPGIFDEAAG